MQPVDQDEAGVIEEAWLLAKARVRRDHDRALFGGEPMTADEDRRLFHALLHGHAGEQMTRDELVKIAAQAMDWARHVRIQAAVLAAVLRGEVLIRWQGDEPQFAWPSPQSHTEHRGAVE